jgi:valyl-tRNA synthetase
MLYKLQQSIETISAHMDNYRLSEAYEAVYHFVWDDFADWYVEASKHEINPGLLRYGLDAVLKLSHPFAPFVTETIWQTLDWTGGSLLMSERWPEKESYDDKKVQVFEDIRTIVTEIRAIKNALQLKKTSLYYSDVSFLRDHAEMLKGLARLDSIKEVEAGHGLHLTTTPHNCWLDVDRETTEHYVVKLQKQLQEAENKQQGYKKRLDNKDYVKQAPKQLVDETKAQLAETEQLVANIQAQITRFSSPE